MTRRALLATLSALPLVGPLLAKLAPKPLFDYKLATKAAIQHAAKYPPTVTASWPLLYPHTGHSTKPNAALIHLQDALRDAEIQRRLNLSWYDHFKNDFLHGSPEPGQKITGILHPEDPKSTP